MRFLYEKRSSNSTEQWISVSDLMSGLMVVFLFIAVIYIQYATRAYREFEDKFSKYEDIKSKIYFDLRKEFDINLIEWGAEIEKETLTIRFFSPEILFDAGSATVSPRFQEILNSFFPKYINLLENKYSEWIKEIKIEGHTSSEWIGTLDQNEAFIKNMELSQKRTRNVLMFCLNMPVSEKYGVWLRTHMTSNGYSSSRLVMNDSKEDKIKSRRVEFTVQVRDDYLLRR